jgi:hypothetical protein
MPAKVWIKRTTPVGLQNPAHAVSWELVDGHRLVAHTHRVAKDAQALAANSARSVHVSLGRADPIIGDRMPCCK